MFFVLIFFLLVFFCAPKNINAQIPLFYQLSEAYQPSNINRPTIIQPTPFPTLVPTPTINPNVLGVTTINPSINNNNNVQDNKIYKIAVLGDSMVDVLGQNIPQLVLSLKKYLPSKKFIVLNYGFGASNIEYGFFRLNNGYKYLDKNFPGLISTSPDIIIIESFAYNNFGNCQSGFDKQWLSLESITNDIKSKLPQTKIVLASTIAPNSLIFADGIPDTNFSSMEKVEKTNTIKLYLQNLINFANSKHFPLADAFHSSLVNNEGMLDLINPTDNLHLSDLGKEFFCDVLAKTIFDNKIVQ
jgi:hypothetical protein